MSSKPSQLLNLAKEIGYKEAVQKVYSDDIDRKQWILSSTRACALLCTSINRESIVLDCGCGYGAISFFASAICKEVHCMDTDYNAIEFIRIRMQQDNIKNIYPLIGNLFNLPYRSEYFDLIILNGVLEYFPLFDESKNPQSIQLEGLRRLRDVLKIGGEIYIAIENRFGLQYMIGLKDEHTNLRFITLLPRIIANIYYKLLTKNSYRVYTHSYFGLKRLLNKCKFDVKYIFSPIPNYRFPSLIFNSDNKYNLPFILKFIDKNLLADKITFKRRLYKVLSNIVILFKLYHLPIHKLFSPCFVIIGIKK